MKVCIVSDSHDNRAFLATAVDDAKSRGAEMVLHCGDVVAPTTLRGLPPIGLPVHVIHGNNTGDLVNMHALVKSFPEMIQYHGQDAELEIAGRKIFLVHYPHYANAMALTGDYDLVCCGHDHRFLGLFFQRPQQSMFAGVSTVRFGDSNVIHTFGETQQASTRVSQFAQ